MSVAPRNDLLSNTLQPISSEAGGANSSKDLGGSSQGHLLGVLSKNTMSELQPHQHTGTTELSMSQSHEIFAVRDELAH